MRRKIQGKWTKIKRGLVVAPSANNCKAKITAYNDIAYSLLTSKVNPINYNNYGNIVKRKRKTNKANLWKNGHISKAYKSFHKIEQKEIKHNMNNLIMEKRIYTNNKYGLCE